MFINWSNIIVHKLHVNYYQNSHFGIEINTIVNINNFFAYQALSYGTSRQVGRSKATK